MERRPFEPEHEDFRTAFRAFVERAIVPPYPAWDPISGAWVDNRVAKIYGGSNEIMQETIGRQLVSGD